MPRKKPTPAPEPVVDRSKPTTDEARVLAHMIRMNQAPAVVTPVYERFRRALGACVINTYSSLGVPQEHQDLVFPVLKLAFEGAFVLGYLVADSEHPKAAGE